MYLLSAPVSGSVRVMWSLPMMTVSALFPSRPLARQLKPQKHAKRKRHAIAPGFLAGEVGLDVYGMREALAAKGLKYV